MKNINKKTGILVGTGVILSIGAFIGAMIRRKRRNTSKFAREDMELYEMEEGKSSLCLHELDVEDIAEDDVDSLDELDFLVAEYLKEETKSEEEKQEEFRELSVKIMDLLLREVISTGEVVKKMEKEISKQKEYREFMEELEQSKDEIISLWEHLEALSNMREEHIIEKDGR